MKPDNQRHIRLQRVLELSPRFTMIMRTMTSEIPCSFLCHRQIDWQRDKQTYRQTWLIMIPSSLGL